MKRMWPFVSLFLLVVSIKVWGQPTRGKLQMKILGFAAVVEVFYSYLCKMLCYLQTVLVEGFLWLLFASGGGKNTIEGFRESCN
jgi:hypothetical protein